MKDFTLIQRLNETKDEISTPSASSIEYQQYEIEVDGKTQAISIPLRETENFESAASEMDLPITRQDLKAILREFRGIRG